MQKNCAHHVLNWYRFRMIWKYSGILISSTFTSQKFVKFEIFVTFLEKHSITKKSQCKVVVHSITWNRSDLCLQVEKSKLKFYNSKRNYLVYTLKFSRCDLCNSKHMFVFYLWKFTDFQSFWNYFPWEWVLGNVREVQQKTRSIFRIVK